MERKKRLKIKSEIVVARLIKLKEKSKHSTIVSKKSPVTKRLIMDFILLIPLCSMVRATERLLLEVNFIEQVYVLKLAAQLRY